MADLAECQRQQENEYLIEACGHESVHEHLARFDEIRREEGDLAKLKDKIQEAIDNYYELGQFEVWWQNTARTHWLDLGTVSAPKIMTFSHNDDGLRSMLANYRHCAWSNDRVEQAWRLLMHCFSDSRRTSTS